MSTAHTPAEGVTKFLLHWTPATAPDQREITTLQDWRDVFFARQLIGADPQRYGGIGFGNVSCRSPQGFLVSATQTGGLPTLSAHNFCTVTGWDILRNEIRARGPQPPSSEALSHAACYAARSDIHWVFHVHSPLLWQAAAPLGMAATPLDAEYGTPAMAEAISSIIHNAHLPVLLQMAGHEDGIIAAGNSAAQCGALLLEAVLRAQLSSALRK
ncbi:class II aldolase/adducin family protein [Acidithiobacillus sulfurivorans]|uniref:Class II aldolase/adducin family protein n=1 Tax=Acidithiobacillus sulfurivorans TaxID=1958756 RepID=A0ABS5ZYW5_9PROT|nr:class II aldolase/adducin family protein [Acidithiobacillus sulfurivorans]MBU2760418.1 class II aldolase/adducin family protein [Acidithiobacillus sulfurivorans]